MSDAPKSAFAALDTGYLTRAKNELIHAIPSDPTFLAHVGMLLRALVVAELQDPARIQRDLEFAKQAEVQAEKDLAARHETEKAAVEAAGASDDAKAALDARHEKERTQAAADKAMADLLAQQRVDQEALAQKQAEARAALQQGATAKAA